MVHPITAEHSTTRMIRWDMHLGEPTAIQAFTRPAVYLDHWAIRRFSHEPVLAQRFTAALKEGNGTWVLSLLNFMEYITMTDKRQAMELEALMDRALPHLFFMDFQAFEVVDREKALLPGGSYNAPFGDVGLLSTYAATWPDRPNTFTAKGLITRIVQDGHQLLPGLAEFKQTIVSRTESMREQMRNDPELEKVVKGSQQAAMAQRTKLYAREFIGNLMLDRNKKITENDAMDLFHVIVPVAYCDLVLLDAEWKHRVDAVTQRLAEQGIPLSPATAFSAKRGGLEQFLRRLEGRST